MLPAMKLRRRHRNPAQRLRSAVEALPRRSREAMLRGIESGPIVVGAYSDRASGGVCPMLAAHRNGGRTDLASFARAWDCFAGARRPRLATERELRALRSYLEISLVEDAGAAESLSDAAARLRSERSASRARGPERAPTGERDRRPELRGRERWSWTRPARRYDTFRRRIAAASEQLAGADGPSRTERQRATAGR